MHASARCLQNLLALLDPVKLDESILTTGVTGLSCPEFHFILNEHAFDDAKTTLLEESFLQWDTKNHSLSMHRDLQIAVIETLTPEERNAYVDNAVKILGHGLDNTWGLVTTHQFKTWDLWEVRVPHIQTLAENSLQFDIVSNDRSAFSELVFRCAWYLYERELFADAERLIGHGLRILDFEDKLSYASACTLRGLIQLDILEPSRALQYFQQGLEIRMRFLPSNDARVASSYNAISLAYTELGQLEEAEKAGNRAIQIRSESNVERLGNSYSNMASTLLRMGRPDEAESMLARCQAYEEFTDDAFLETGNPRFAGDMILLGRIRAQQGRLDEAISLLSKALVFRQQTHGNHLKTCDTLQTLAEMLQRNSDIRAAITLWTQSDTIAASNLPEAEAYFVRAKYCLARCYELVDEADVSRTWQRSADTAHKEYVKRKGHAVEISEDPVAFYDGQVPWMLW